MSNLYSNILITGGNGMLAAAFAHVFAERNITPRLVDRASCDIADEVAVEKVFDANPPSLVINCAAYTKVDLAEKEIDKANAVNGTAVGTLARICRESNTPLVHFSTDYVFDGTLTRPLRPGDPVGPVSVYGRSKLLGEQALQKNAPPRWLILRTAWLYGPGGPNFPQAILNAARAGKPLKVVSDQIGSPTYTRDLATATLDLIDAGASGIYHLTNSGETNWRDFTAAVLEEFGIDQPVESITSADWKSTRPDSASRPAYSVLDTSPYAELVGTPMPNWRDGLKRYRAAMNE